MNEHIHHLDHFVIYSLLIWQVALVFYLLLRYYFKNKPPMLIGSNQQNFIKKYEEPLREGRKLGVVDVDVKKNILIGTPDHASVLIDEVKKEKVITQADKLRKLKK